MTKEQFEAIANWQDKTFPKATAISKLHHLKEEVEELIKDLESGNPNRRLEYADCMILIFGSANSDGMSYEDCCNCIKEKFDIVKERKWGEPDENGVVKHIKDDTVKEDIPFHKNYDSLSNYMFNEYDLILTIEEMDEIILESKKVVDNINK